MQIETTMWYHCTSTRRATIKILTIPRTGEDEEQLNYYIAGGNEKWYSPSENSLAASYGIKYVMTRIPSMVTYPRGMRISVHVKICTQLLRPMLILISAPISSGRECLWNEREFISLCAVFVRERGCKEKGFGAWREGSSLSLSQGEWGSWDWGYREKQVCELLPSPVKSSEAVDRAPRRESSGQALLGPSFLEKNMMRNVFQPGCSSSKSDFNLLLKRKVTFLAL